MIQWSGSDSVTYMVTPISTVVSPRTTGPPGYTTLLMFADCVEMVAVAPDENPDVSVV